MTASAPGKGIGAGAGPAAQKDPVAGTQPGAERALGGSLVPTAARSLVGCPAGWSAGRRCPVARWRRKSLLRIARVRTAMATDPADRRVADCRPADCRPDERQPAERQPAVRGGAVRSAGLIPGVVAQVAANPAVARWVELFAGVAR